MEAVNLYVFDRCSRYKVISYAVKEGSKVKKDSILATYEIIGDQEATHYSLRSPSDGIVKSLLAAANVASSGSEAVMNLVEDCDHSIQVRGICAICAVDLHNSQRTTISLTYDSLGVTVSPDVAARFDREAVARLRDHKKLALILDLDQTLIHTTTDPLILRSFASYHLEDKGELLGFTLSNQSIPYYVKLRPGVRKFLKDMSSLYELHVYTMGTRDYAVKISGILDPSGSLFNHRILTREESGSFLFKTVARIFPCDQSMVVVVDDRSDIWKWSQNLYQVVPYVFFQGTADINATVHCNSLEVNIDNQQISTRYEPPGGESCSGRPQTDTKDNTLEEDFQNIEKPQFSDVDNELEIVASVLKEIHTQYYSLACSDDTGGLKPNTCSIMSRMKSNVLKGTKIVFSGISPTNADITSNELWIGASIFGAECSLELDSSVTHVVSVRNNSMKAIMSRKYLNVYLVRPEWLVHSIGRWMRQDEVEYRHPEPPVSPETFERDNTIFQHGDIPGADRVEIFEDFAGRTMNGAEIVPHISKEEWDKMNAEVDEVLCESSTSDNSGASSSGDYPDAGRHGIEYESDNRHPRGDTLSVSGSSGTDGDGRLHKCLKISGTSSTPSQDQADDAWNELNEVLSEGFADEFSGREI